MAVRVSLLDELFGYMTQARWFIVVLLGLILGETNLNDKY
jgi:hypothetical protein